ncbi:hypothetical protein DQ04_00251300 [Trypanosoma grayi]|uniref:hypothetical protein n=1 Tax=Trypanosoma grayi TaxID=71804 RepID=UPI0004F3F84F|nr:hypothetical protein DQ04_00251300 [Trypanosoma grayi]KEG14954.1 hypothetical protein DQ04_00251300 [Trypanosoma grayi]
MARSGPTLNQMKAWLGQKGVRQFNTGNWRRARERARHGWKHLGWKAALPHGARKRRGAHTSPGQNAVWRILTVGLKVGSADGPTPGGGGGRSENCGTRALGADIGQWLRQGGRW